MIKLQPKLSHYMRQDGTRQIIIEVRAGSRNSKVTTQAHALPEEWDKERGCFKETNERAVKLNSYLRKEVQRLDDAYIDLLRFDPSNVTPSKIIRKSKIDGKVYVTEYIRDVIVPDANSKSSQYGYGNLARLLDKHHKGARFQDIDHRFVAKFQKTLSKTKKRNSVNVILTMFKTVINRAVKDQIARYEVHPFADITLHKEQPKTYYLTVEEVKKLEDYNTTDLTLKRAVDFWLFMYYLNGARLSDALSIHHDDIRGDRIVYTMHKVADKSYTPTVEVMIHSKLQGLLDRYSGIHYVFPYLHRNIVKGSDLWYKEKTNVTTKLNYLYKKVAKELGFEKLTPHMARRSFANHLRDIGADMYSIQTALNHSSEKVTEQYLRGETKRNERFLQTVYL